MTELNFKGKEFVYNHHLAVPFRPLVPDESKGIGPVALDVSLLSLLGVLIAYLIARSLF